MKTILKLALPLLAAAALAGCDNAQDMAEKQAERIAKEHGVDMDIDRGADGSATITMDGPDGTKLTTGENVALPGDFPSDIAAYPGWKLAAVSTVPTGFVVHAQSDDKPADIAAFYEKELVAKGWTKDPNAVAVMGEMHTLTFTKDKRQTNLVVIGGTPTSVQLSTLNGG